MEATRRGEVWNFIEHIRSLYRHDEIYLIVNNYEPDRHDKILEWASKQKRSFKVYFTPASLFLAQTS